MDPKSRPPNILDGGGRELQQIPAAVINTQFEPEFRRRSCPVLQKPFAATPDSG
jgi:hypothetical protein